MTAQVDIWLRGTDFATTQAIEGIDREPRAWTDEDVRRLLEEMLKTMHRLKYGSARKDWSVQPGDDVELDLPVTLRGLSWIVNPYDEHGVVVAIEITLGAAVAGPFAIDKAALEAMIARVLVQPSEPKSLH